MHQILINYWWLRSPDMANGYGAYFVRSSGDLDSRDFNLGYSYGRTISPDSFMYYNYTSFYVIEDGSMITYAVEYFYGNILISSHVNISSLCRISGLKEYVFQLFYFHKGA